MFPRSLPPAILASTVALAVVAGPLVASAYAAADGGGNAGNSDGSAGPGRTRRTRTARRARRDRRRPKGPKGPQQGPDDELDGSYDGELVSTNLDTSNKPTAQPLTAYEMPFPCGEVWTGTTRSSHSPSVAFGRLQPDRRPRGPGRGRRRRSGDHGGDRQEPSVLRPVRGRSTTATTSPRSTRTWTR